MTEMCPCGQPLHYSDPGLRTKVSLLVLRLGPTIPVETTRGTWAIPRHYLALHGLAEVEVLTLAERYGWKRVD